MTMAEFTKKVRANISYRVQYGFWKDPRRFDELLAEFVRLRDSFDEVVLHSAYTHSVRSLDVIADDMPEFNLAIAKCHAQGIRCGFNLLASYGHHGEDFRAIPANIEPFYGMNGDSCSGTVCLNSEANWVNYIEPMLKLYASADIDFFWLDDDNRFCGHGNLGLICFCDNCMKKFNELHKSSLSREDLVALFDHGDAADRLMWRKRWLEFSGMNLCKNFRRMEQIIHSVKPDMEIGTMDAGMRPGDSASYEDQVAALTADDPSRPIRWRPGGGAYTDERFDDILQKAMNCGCESALLPEQVNNIQAEVENFNYRRLMKSIRSVKLEASLSVSAGLTGCAWNISCTADPLFTYIPLMNALAAHRPFLDRLAVYSRVRPSGVWHGWKPGMFAAKGLSYTEEFPWENTPGTAFGNALDSGIFKCGIPAAFRIDEAIITVITPDVAWMLTDEELQTVFSRGVYVIAEALPILERRGFAELTGFRIAGVSNVDAQEELLDHKLNSGCAGYIRNCYQSFFRTAKNNDGKGWHLESIDGKGESLARLINYAGDVLTECSLGIYENRLGGRVAVAGYYPLMNLEFYTKTHSLKQLFFWLSRGKLSYGVSYHRTVLFVRDVPGEGVLAQVTNMSADPAENVEVFISGGTPVMSVTDEELNETTVCGSSRENGYSYILPYMAPWTTLLLRPVK